MERIKENEVKKFLESYNYKNLKVQISGIIEQACYFEKAQITFLNDDAEIKIQDLKNNIILKFCYIEEIYFMQKNKLKFLTNNDLEILIIFL